MVLLTILLTAGCGSSGGKEPGSAPTSGRVMEEAHEYTGGVNPALACTPDGWVVEVHEASGKDHVWYNVGQFAGDGTFKWLGDPSDYGTGVEPGVAMTDDGYIVMVHRARNGNGLWYDTGKLDKNTGKISWLHNGDYDTGSYPGVIIFNDGWVLETHRSTVGSQPWYKIGQINPADNTIGFGGSRELEGTAFLASFKPIDKFVQLSKEGHRFGQLDKQNRTITWLGPRKDVPDLSSINVFNKQSGRWVLTQMTNWSEAAAYTFQAPGGNPQVAFLVSGNRRDLFLGQARVEGLDTNPRLNNAHLENIGGGEQPAFAGAVTRAIDLHRSAAVTGGVLWYSTGNLEPR
ncbi:MAG: hypothetical protein ACYC99_06695 [Candidatus Geothermincolia bacterium]